MDMWREHQVMDRVIARHLLMPLIHGLRGEPVRRHAVSLSRSEWWSGDQLQDYRFRALRALLDHAYRESSFYRTRFERSGVAPGDIATPEDLALLPFLEKGEVPDLLRTIRAPSFPPGRISRRQTAGSTGTPLTVLADPDTSARSFAARIRFQGWHGLKPGDRQVRFWGRPLTGSLRKARLKDALLNRIMIDSTALEPERVPATLQRIQSFGPDYAYGYTSMLQAFAEAMGAGGLTGRDLGLRIAIYTSETCLPSQRAQLAETFACPVVPEYGCSEVDIIAFGCPAGGLHINAENLWVEVVPSADAPPGSGEVVVTDLGNRLMPLIRYRLGDLASLVAGPCSCGRGLPLLGEIAGRSQGQFIITSRGSRIHSQTLAYLFEAMAAQGLPLRQFQIVQEAIGRLRVDLSLPPDAAVDQIGITARIREQAQALLQERCDVEVRFVAEADAGRKGRKFRHFESRLGQGAGAREGDGA